MKKLLYIVIALVVIGGLLLYRGIHMKTGELEDPVTITIEAGLSVREIAALLEEQGLVYSDTMLVRYLAFKKLDTKIQNGDFTFDPPHTIARVAETLTSAQSLAEREITILPGWNLRDIAAYLEEEQIGAAETFFAATGKPLERGGGEYPLQDIPAFSDVPGTANLEGYLRPDTYRIFESASIYDIVDKLVKARAAQFTDQMLADIQAQGKTMHEIITMASILEREVRTPEDQKLVSDLFWRRNEIGMGLQADSSVHYIVGTDDDVFTTAADRATDSLWNTYKYPGLPEGPISTPSISAIMAAIYPEPNDYWYFLTTLDTGEVKYGRTLDEHNQNVAQYLRR